MAAGIKVTIGDKEYNVPPLNLKALIELKERLKAFKPDTYDPESLELILECSFRALKRNYPEITRDELAEHIDIGNMHEVMAAVMDASGLKRKRLEKEASGTGGGAEPGEALTTTATGNT